MNETEWRDGDDPKLRALLGYALRDHVCYQDGRHSEAPALLFADYDFEVGDGTCGVAEDGKWCNEPAIVYARADALMDAIARAEKAESAARTAYAQGLKDATKVADEKENYWNTVAYDRRQAGRDDSFACASANSAWEVSDAIRALAPDPFGSPTNDKTG